MPRRISAPGSRIASQEMYIVAASLRDASPSPFNRPSLALRTRLRGAFGVAGSEATTGSTGEERVLDERAALA